MLAAVLLRCRDDPIARYALQIGFGASLRVSELRSLRVASLQRDEEEKNDTSRGQVLLSPWTLCLTVDKRARSQATGKQAHFKPVTDEVAKAISQWAREGGLGPQDFLFPRDIDKRLSRVLTESAVALGWPSDLAWGGTHVMRIGGSRDIVRRVEGGTTRAHVAADGKDPEGVCPVQCSKKQGVGE